MTANEAFAASDNSHSSKQLDMERRMRNSPLTALVVLVFFILTSSTMPGKTLTSRTIIVEADGPIRLDSYACTGNIDKLTTPWQNAVDGDWNTKLAWNNSLLGDFSVVIIENYSLSTSLANATWEFKAYHCNNGSLIPTPMRIECWNGSSWISIYGLDDQEHFNEQFTETIDIPSFLISDRMTFKTTIMYSSHVAGGVLPNPPVRMLHYVEYFEGKLAETAIPEFSSLLVLSSFMIATLLIVTLYNRKKQKLRLTFAF